MSILSLIGSIFQPAAKLIDDLHTSTEEKMTLQNEMMKIQNDLQSKVLDYESKLMTAQSDVIKAEATGHSWIQQNWRPITMLTFLVLVVLDSFGWLHNKLAPEAWTLLQIGLGGYVIGRSAEKVIPSIFKGSEGQAKG